MSGCKHDLLHCRAGVLRIASSFRISGWAGSTSLSRYAPINIKMLQIRLGQQILQQIERRRVEPLQVVEEER